MTHKATIRSAILSICLMAGLAAEQLTPFSDFETTFPKDPSFFPIGVWAQNPANAGKYKALGINYYIGLWKGPTAAQIAELKKHQMPVICSLNSYAEKNLLNEPLVVGWMHADEPDLAHHHTRKKLQAAGGKDIIKKNWPEIYKEMDLGNKAYKGWGHGKHPINETLVDYKKWRAIDNTRPILIQLSKAVALEGIYKGRGDRSGKTWEYPHYITASDTVSFDIYPVAYGDPDKLYQVADGVDAIKKWSNKDKPINVCIEAGFGDKEFATEAQMRAEIWMAINHGADSITWFVHRWQNKKLVSDSMPLANAKVGTAVKNINSELTSLAAVINSNELNDIVRASGAQLDLGARRHGKATYVFAVERGNKGGKAQIRVKGIKKGTVEVINEGRSIEIKNGLFNDTFTAFGTHLYKINE